MEEFDKSCYAWGMSETLENLYVNLLDIELPLEVVGIDRDAKSKVVIVYVKHSSEIP